MLLLLLCVVYYFFPLFMHNPFSFFLFLLFAVPAKIIEHLSTGNLMVRENEKVTLVCNVTGVPVPEVTWYRHIRDEKGVEKQSEFCPSTDRKHQSREFIDPFLPVPSCGCIFSVVHTNCSLPSLSLLSSLLSSLSISRVHVACTQLGVWICGSCDRIKSDLLPAFCPLRFVAPKRV